MLSHPTVATKIPPELRDKLTAYCLEHDITVTQVLRRLIREFFDELEVKNG